MGKKSAVKGKNGEREFIRQVSRLTHGCVELSRNLSQCRDGGDDCLGHDVFSIEVKRRRDAISDAQVAQWWAVCVSNAQLRHKHPVLAYRQDFQSWKVMLNLCEPFGLEDVRGCLTMDIELFCHWLIQPGCIGHPDFSEETDHDPGETEPLPGDGARPGLRRPALGTGAGDH